LCPDPAPTTLNDDFNRILGLHHILFVNAQMSGLNTLEDGKEVAEKKSKVGKKKNFGQGLRINS